MTAADAILGVIGAGAVAYVLLGGADLGGGVWDLFASGPRRAQQRSLIATTMGPVWEANHVWLVFVLIGLFSGFPAAFGALCRLLAVPLALALLGIVLRGAAFVFRQYGSTGASAGTSGEAAGAIEAAGAAKAGGAADGSGAAGAGPVPGTAAWGRVFAIASTFTPAALGLCAGAVATGRLGGAFPVVAAALGLALCAYLAAVYLCREAVVRSGKTLVRDFRRRALLAAVVAGALALVALPVLGHDAPALTARLWQRAWWLVALSAVGGVASIATVARYRFGLARGFAALAVASVLAGWGVASYPYLVPPGLTVADAAGPVQTQPVILAVLVAGFLVTVPALALLLRVFGRPGPTRTGRSPRW
jgi:cytochrome d ubiquinol oxidase subunit II